MSVRPLRLILILAAVLPAAFAQERKHVAFPERDALTPFRAPSEIYAPPDRLYSLLRRMRAMAANPANERSTDEDGREVLALEAWREIHGEVERIGLDAGYLASIMRMSKNDDDRRTAFYAMFYCDRVDYVMNLIGHIPGEPLRATRQEAFARAIEYLKANLNRRFGDLDPDHKKAILEAMPEIGSPVAKQRGIVREPRDDDHLNQLGLIPFFQLLDVDEPIDQAQALWFLKEVFTLRIDLAQLWLEPVLPRLRQLLISDDAKVREQVTGLLRAIGPKDLPEAPVDDPVGLRDWAEIAIRNLFPPIRNINDALIVLFPSEDRDRIVKAAVEGLVDSAIGDPYTGKDEAGERVRGFRLATMPDELEPLAIPRGAIITSLNGAMVHDAESLLQTATRLIESLGTPRKLLVEYVVEGKRKAVEYRIM